MDTTDQALGQFAGEFNAVWMISSTIILWPWSTDAKGWTATMDESESLSQAEDF